MTKLEALQKFKSHIRLVALRADFPDIDFTATRLDDGQLEIVIHLHGVDPDYNPEADIAAINAMTVEDLPDGKIKNSIVLRKHKHVRTQKRKDRRDRALLKRVKALVAPAGVSLRRIAKVIVNSIPMEDEL
jgi:hypothetical protein